MKDGTVAKMHPSWIADVFRCPANVLRVPQAVSISSGKAKYSLYLYSLGLYMLKLQVNYTRKLSVDLLSVKSAFLCVQKEERSELCFSNQADLDLPSFLA